MTVVPTPTRQTAATSSVVELNVLVGIGCVFIISETIQATSETVSRLEALDPIKSVTVRTATCLIVNFNETIDWGRDLKKPVYEILRPTNCEILSHEAAIFPRDSSRHVFSVISVTENTIKLINYGFHEANKHYDYKTISSIVEKLMSLSEVRFCDWSIAEHTYSSPIKRPWWYWPRFEKGRRRRPISFDITFERFFWPALQETVRKAIEEAVGSTVIFDGHS